MLLKISKIKSTVLVISLISLSACASSNNKNKLEYQTPGVKNASDRLVIPPDITGINTDDKYKLPSGAVRASEYNRQQNLKTGGSVLPTIDSAYIERTGNQRWLVVKDKTPHELWPSLNYFWQDMGFVINKEERATGLMETQWAENRANIPGDPIRDFLTNIGLGSAYSSAIRDKFVIRVESNQTGGSLVSFTNQRREEVFVGKDKNTTKWVSKPGDPNLEAQFLARYMLTLGYDQEKVAKELSKKDGSTLAAIDNNSLLLKGNEHNRNRYRLKLALERIGFTVIEYSNNSDTIIVSPALDYDVKEDNPGILSRVFKGTPKKNPQTSNQPREKIIVTITQAKNHDVVRIYDSNRQAYKNQDLILKKLYQELR